MKDVMISDPSFDKLVAISDWFFEILQCRPLLHTISDVSDTSLTTDEIYIYRFPVDSYATMFALKFDGQICSMLV